MKIIAIEEHWNSASIRDALDRLPGIARHLQRRVSDYIKTNIHVTSSGMLQEHLLRHTLDFTSADQVLFSTDYPFHQRGRAQPRSGSSSTPSPTPRTAPRSPSATPKPCST